MSTKTPPAPKKKNAELDKAAAELRALRAKKKDTSPKEKKSPASTSPKATPKKKKDTALVVLPPIEPADGDLTAIIKKRVTISGDHKSLVIDDDTPMPEYLRIFDDSYAGVENNQWLFGSVIAEGRRIYGTTFGEIMARTGRPISSLEKYETTVKNIPPALRSLHPKVMFSHCAEVARLPKLSDREFILKKAAASAEKGSPMTKSEVRVLASEKKPKRTATKPAAKKAKVDKDKPDLEMNALEKEMYDELEEIVIRLDRCIEGVPFVLDMSSTQTATLREKLERIARFYTQIS